MIKTGSPTTQDVVSAEASVPLTSWEKQALSDDIHRLDDKGLSGVYGIILARIPIGSSGSQGLELDMDFIDVITLRHLQGYIREPSEGTCS